jgi:hypothetical protein
MLNDAIQKAQCRPPVYSPGKAQHLFRRWGGQVAFVQRDVFVALRAVDGALAFSHSMICGSSLK